MKIQKNIFILSCMLCFPYCSEVCAQTNNLLKNGDFETGVAKPWTNRKEQIAVTSKNVHSGSYALEIKKGTEPISQTVSIKPNSEYKLSGYLKTASGAETLELGTVMSGKRSSISSALVSWSRIEQVFYSGPDDKSVQIEILFPGSGIKTAWADDIKVEYLGPHTVEKQSGIRPLPERVPVVDLGINQQPNEKLNWLLDAKFGLFIHWGLYAGHAQGEWYMNWGKVPIIKYRKLAYPESGDEQFTAKQFRPDEWARIAIDAGMKYMNLTAMHHDGFALFESSYSNAFTAKQALGRDLVKEYVDACRKAGLRVGLFKTLINWRYPGYYDIEGSPNSPYFNANNKWGYKSVPQNRENARIMKEELYYQTKELMTKYGKIDQVFWDGGWLAEKNSNADAAFFWEPGKYRSPDNPWPVDSNFIEVEKGTGKPMGLMGIVRKYQPDILVNPRSGWIGDYMSEEGASPITGPIRSKEIYEKCLSVYGEAWGYEKNGEDSTQLMPADKLKRILSDCIIRNMVLLVNVGPDRHGVIPVAQANRLKEVGQWLSKIGEAVYGTRGGPWNPTDGQFGYSYKDKTIYVYIYRDYAGNKITLPSVDTRNIVRAYNVYDKKPLKFSQNKKHEITVYGINRTQHPEVTVIAVQLDSKVF